MQVATDRIASGMQRKQQPDLLCGLDVDPVADQVTRASDAYASSQADLVREIGMQPLALTQWRGGKRRPSPATLRAMAKELIRKSDELRYWSLGLEALAGEEAKRKTRSRKAVQRSSTHGSEE